MNSPWLRLAAPVVWVDGPSPGLYLAPAQLTHTDTGHSGHCPDTALDTRYLFQFRENLQGVQWKLNSWTPGGEQTFLLE